jgi:hypothetical protein
VEPTSASGPTQTSGYVRFRAAARVVADIECASPKANRRPSRQPFYDQSDVRRLTFIRRCRDFGFPIEQVHELVKLADSAERDCIAARDLAQARLDDVRLSWPSCRR